MGKEKLQEQKRVKTFTKLDDNSHFRLPPAFVCYCLIFLFSILFRWTVSVGPYSGYAKPPLFGDFEAQRHWMEITYNLPIKEWYVNTTENDLLYWGLDYPPLTAYHSWFLGFISSKLNSSWIELKTSRGIESYQHKLFMRYTVLISDCLIFIPAVYVFVLHFQKPKHLLSQVSFLITWLLYPGFLLIDYGHFQYNCISLGLFLWSIICFLARKDLLGSVSFCLALNYKQMELYHSLPIFCYLLGSCLELNLFQGLSKLVKLGCTVLLSFALLWLPFMTSLENATQVVHRIFPVARGIYEDKVANVWCSLSVLIKWKSIFSSSQIATLSAFITLVLLLPCAVMVLLRPTKQQLKYSTIVSSLIFFLFSFQVHEKSILLVALPVLLILNETPFVCCWILLISVISLFPLAVKDDMQIAFFALFIAYYVWVIDFLRSCQQTLTSNVRNLFQKETLFHVTLFVGFVLCSISLVTNPPQRYPDLFTLLISAFCCFCFVCFLVYFYYKQFLIFVDWQKKKLN